MALSLSLAFPLREGSIKTDSNPLALENPQVGQAYGQGREQDDGQSGGLAGFSLSHCSVSMGNEGSE